MQRASSRIVSLKCQSHTGTKRVFIPQPRNIDLFIPPHLWITPLHFCITSHCPLTQPFSPLQILCVLSLLPLLSHADLILPWFLKPHNLYMCTHTSQACFLSGFTSKKELTFLYWLALGLFSLEVVFRSQDRHTCFLWGQNYMKTKRVGRSYVPNFIIWYRIDKSHLLAVNHVKTLLNGFPDLLSWFLFAHVVRRAAVQTWLAGMSVISGGGG